MTITNPQPTATTHRVAIIGGGASGVLTAIQMLSASDDPRLQVTIHEATGVVGKGLAYGTSDPRHLLNVRARHMSAFADVPSDLLEWAVRTGRNPDPLGFLPRMEYANYLQDTLAAVADHRLTILAGRVEDIVPTPTGYEIHSSDRVSVADDVVLAYGNQTPATLTVDGEDISDEPWYLPNPWALGAVRTLPKDAVVVLVGTGLTAIDTAITLLEDGPERRVVMASRTGLLPHPHIEQQSTAWVVHVPDGPLTADQLASFYEEQVAAASAQGLDWRNVVDGLRAPTQSIWQRLSLEERRRFLSTYARRWEVRRHRMAPEVGERIEGYRESGRLTIAAGALTRAGTRDGRALVAAGDVEVTADAVVNCTGPMTDLTRSTDPLLLSLRERGLATPDALRLGVNCTTTGQLLDPAGLPVTGLFTVGPPRKGTLWESTAIPEIRGQAAEVARAILARVPVS